MTHTAPPNQPADPNDDHLVDSLVGTVVDGRYEVRALLSEGGMGRLYEVVQVALGQRAVLKTILPKFARNRRVVERFLREARAASQVGNPHIIDIRDSGTLADGRAYYVMEFLDGRDVRALLDELVVVEEERVIDVACQVLSALEAAHGQGLVHRDLKPENIFLTRGARGQMHAKVVDFGLVRFTEGANAAVLTRAGELVGTPHYMSPEQCKGATVDIRSDLYSLGLVIYEMVSGELPYEDDEILQLVLHKATDEYPPFGPLEKLASPELRSILRRCLVADPDMRFPTPRAMRKSLEALRTSRAPVSPPGLVPVTVSPNTTTSDALLATLPGVRRGALAETPARTEPSQAVLEVATPPRPTSSARPPAHRSFIRGAAVAAATFALGAAAIVGLSLVMLSSERKPLHAEAAAAAHERHDLAPTSEPPASSSHTATSSHRASNSRRGGTPPQGLEIPADLALAAPALVEVPHHEAESPAPVHHPARRAHAAPAPDERPPAALEPAPEQRHAAVALEQAEALAERSTPEPSGLFDPWD